MIFFFFFFGGITTCGSASLKLDVCKALGAEAHSQTHSGMSRSSNLFSMEGQKEEVISGRW